MTEGERAIEGEIAWEGQGEGCQREGGKGKWCKKHIIGRPGRAELMTEKR